MLQLSSIAFVVLYARSLFGYMSNLGLHRKIDLIRESRFYFSNRLVFLVFLQGMSGSVQRIFFKC